MNKPTLEQVFTNPRVVEARKAITLYKMSDPALALFRRKAARMLLEITVRGVERKRLTVAQRAYIAPWLTDGNDMFRVYFAELNRALGYRFIEGDKS